MPISICFTLRLNGVLSIGITIKPNVTMPTIGRTSEERPIFLTTMLLNCALIGKLEHSLANMMKDVFFRQHVLSVTGGKNKSTIH